ncbi:hypothetical protein DFP72DRAFT_1010551 [Ephemerocybe angulata]|uniref:MYND-type domain-containing protein n=1 Tax=Ephemerocybe angulata TaxID=980116 RepID=A0A8H6HV03_9AGAR|nr:hypothetical protein DFP72DRAFT_1010551 [Tulosesus angulatus]
MAPTDQDYISKDDLFSVLESMKITLPRTSKMSVEDLSKRLREGLNVSQRVEDLLSGEPLDPRQLQPWTDVEGLVQQTAVMQQSLKSNFDRMSTMGTSKTPEELKGETLHQLQDILLWLGFRFTMGERNLYLVGKETGDWAVAIRIHGVYAMNEKTPVFVLSHRTVTSIPNKTLEEQLSEIFNAQPRSGQAVESVAQRTFLRLLSINAKRVLAGYEPDGTENKKYTKKKWKLTFALPLGPLPMAKVGKLADEHGCDVCGSTENASRCVQCLSAIYCSPECQKRDWPKHKEACRTLQGATWTTIDFGDNPSSPIDGLNTGYMSLMNVHESWEHGSSSANKAPQPIGANVPKNVHGEKMFLVKFQAPMGGPGYRPSSMMLYDRQRSFTIHWKRSGDPAAFLVAEKAMGDYPKMYRWAKRTGNRTMSVCFERAPKENPPW